MSRVKAVSKQYQKKSHLEHIKERPDTYIGSCQCITEERFVEAGGKFEKREITFVPGLYKIFDEILVNAADNKRRDESMKSIKIHITDFSITIENDGAGIPVVMHERENMWVPQMVFGELLSGDNYDDSTERVVGGRNGYGAKLANIFSTTFCIETVDSKARKKYVQTWQNNMENCSKPQINASGKRKDYTRVTFAPDFAKFGLTSLTPDMKALFRKRVFDVAGTTPKDVRVYLNGVKIPIQNFKQYCGLYFDNHMPMYQQLNDRWEICIAMAPDQQHQHVSFCNTICTSKGGEHVKYIMDSVAKHVIPSRVFKGLSVRPGQIKNSTFLFVNALITNPSFDSQTKDALTTRLKDFGPVQYKPVISDNFVKSIIKNSGIVEEVLHFARVKSKRQLQRVTGATKKSKLTGIPKLDDANFAGTRRSQECTLILTEGDSAKTLAIAGLSVVGRNTFGVFPLKGKLLNVRDASNQKVGGNSEIQSIMKIMGLNMGRTYSDASSLRYGHIMIMTDQDHDGSHIKGLIINFLHHYWPSLLKIPNFLQVFITPIVKCSKNKQTHVFYTTPEYQVWCDKNNPRQWKIKYYKGLGTSSAKEAKEYFSNLDKNRLHFEIIQDGAQIDMCFNKKRVEDRKAWIGNYRHGTHMDFSKKEMSYNDFVNKEYIVMAIESNLRGIPHVMDGLKPSQRKILFACLKRKLHSEIKVAQLAGYTSEHASYHHGEMSLNNTIVGMAQNFTGSNNIHLLAPNGQFGTRLMGGKDAASARYIFTQLSETAELIFRPEDAPLYEYMEDDGQSIEPAFYLPIIPMILVNGANGIGTGWSTTIPSFNPKDIIQNLKRMLSNQSSLEMAPWSKGFTGSVRAITDTKYEYEGVWTWKNANTIHISELPVGIWTNNYKEYLEKVLDVSDKIVDIKSNHTDTTIAFTVKLSQKHATILRNDSEKLKKFLKMTTTKDTGNMHAFEANGTMKKYNTVQEIMHTFYTKRLGLYGKRKTYQISSIQNSSAKINEKIRFLKAVVSGMILFKGKSKTELVQILESWPFVAENGSFDYLLNMPMWSMSKDKIDELETKSNELATLQGKLQRTSIEQMWKNDLDELELTLYPSRKRNSIQMQTINKKQKVTNK